MRVVADDMDGYASMLDMIAQRFHEAILKVLVVLLRTLRLYEISRVEALGQTLRYVLRKLVEIETSSGKEIYKVDGRGGSCVEELGVAERSPHRVGGGDL